MRFKKQGKTWGEPARATALGVTLLGILGCSHDWDLWRPKSTETGGASPAVIPGTCTGEAGNELLVSTVADANVRGGVRGVCIARTEVTVRDYLQFYASETGQPTPCSGETGGAGGAGGAGGGESASGGQGAGGDAGSGGMRPNNANYADICGDKYLVPGKFAELRCDDVEGAKPIVRVTWCAADAYCKSKGLRLCGDLLEGSDAGWEGINTPTRNEWYAACSNGGATQFPYGNAEPKNGLCNLKVGESTEGGAHVTNSADTSTCANRFGVLDLVGNVAEWTSNCVAEDCIARGHHYDSPGASGCLADETFATSRTSKLDQVGFRCCSDFEPES